MNGLDPSFFTAGHPGAASVTEAATLSVTLTHTAQIHYMAPLSWETLGNSLTFDNDTTEIR